jgi:hypothetical protein
VVFLPWITLGKWYDYEWKMYKKIIIPTCLIFVLVISSGVNGRDVAVAILSQIPRGVAVKIVQGLSVVHGMGVIEIDHRYGRYRTAMQDLQRDHISTAVADTAAIAISEIGHRYLGENKTGSFGTLRG